MDLGNAASGDNIITGNQLYLALQSVVPVASIKKWRVSSLVIDPIVSPSSITGAGDVDLGISGNHFQFAQSNRPLRIRLGKERGDDGEWQVTDGSTTMNSIGQWQAIDPFLTVTLPSIVASWSSKVHFRIAWTDPT